MPTKYKKSNKNSTNNKTKKSRDSGLGSFQRNTVAKFLTLLQTVKLYHWKTRSYATHKATDELYSNLNESIDSFVEILLGKFGNRIEMKEIKTKRGKSMATIWGMNPT
jgi:DNA-binding ferritin-like protein